MGKRKVLYVFCSQHFSGAEIVLERLITTNKDHVQPIALCPPGEFSNRLKAKGVDVFEEPALMSLERNKNKNSAIDKILIMLKRFIRITKRVFQIKKNENVSIIHANNLAAAVYLIPAIHLFKFFKGKFKWVWSNHDISYPDGNKSKLLAKFCHTFYDKTLAVSKAVKDIYPRYINKIEVLYNGLNTHEFCFSEELRKDFRIKYKLEKTTIVIGIVGIISEGKGHHLLIEAFSRLLKNHPNIFLLMIGRFSPYDDYYERKIRLLLEKLPNTNFVVLGHIENVKEAYCGLDILVNATSSTRSEPLGTTIYEAMACERIVIVSNTGGSPEIITDKKDGFLFRTDSIEDLTEKLSYVINNGGLLDELRKNAREKVLNKFDINSMVSNYNHILSAL